MIGNGKMRPEHVRAYNQYIDRWLNGEESGNRSLKTFALSAHIRRYMLDLSSYSCQECGFNKAHPDDGHSVLEIDHIDGNPMNTILSNLRVLCPNCHSLTSTYRGRNKSSLRQR